MTDPQATQLDIEEAVEGAELPSAEVVSPGTMLALQNPASMMMQMLEKAMSNPRMGVEKMREALELQKDFMAMHAEMEFNAAMARLQPSLPFITKKGRISFQEKDSGNQRNTPYARFEDIEEAIRPLYSAEGFSTSYDIESIPGKDAPYMVVVLTIAHNLGHKKQFRSPPMPADNSGKKNPIQALGSTQSYGKRYALTNGFGIVVKGEDDDGNKGGTPAKKKDPFTAKIDQQSKGTTTKRGDREIISEAEQLREDLKALTFKKEREDLIGTKLPLLRELANIKREDVANTLHALVKKGKADGQ